MAETAVLDALTLTNFKSFRSATLPLGRMTLLVGRNGSGKSNALDGLEVLARLATGGSVEDLEGDGIRGEAMDHPTFGETRFSLGCVVRTDDARYAFDLSVATEPEPVVVEERLRILDGAGAGGVAVGSTGKPRTHHRVAGVRVAERSVPLILPPDVPLLLGLRTSAQLWPFGGPADSGDRGALEPLEVAATAVHEALRGVFVLDPVPRDMRQYARGRDGGLLRHGQNLSAAARRILEDPERHRRLLGLVNAVSDLVVEDLSVESSPFGDVMLAIRERFDGRTRVVPARLLSDGVLRFLALAVALLEEPEPYGEEGPAGAPERLLVLEEVENSLHPAQAGRVLELVRDATTSGRVRTLATTHNPALLSALSGSEHAGIVVCDRDPTTGISRLRRLVDLPGYPRIAAKASLGAALTDGTIPGEDVVGRQPGVIERFLEAN